MTTQLETVISLFFYETKKRIHGSNGLHHVWCAWWMKDRADYTGHTAHEQCITKNEDYRAFYENNQNLSD